ncbi:MAG TPA: selenocysteine-specific translation elongation factor [Candidatus Eisenbacteria bacterium]|nr:selenocysteine-specific translation elongation factor [Candidatus Eisenbacteria bacterium]
MAAKNIIVGTAGHIDHGKSSLVEALTGTHPDRLEEEKRRGITIDLGFAFLQEDGVQFGFVDVPGHERFVGNMLAGAAGVDLVLLVIAADESIKPQTREHFDICRLLGVQRGLVVLTKADLVDREALELARLEIEDFLRGSFLAGAPILAVSGKTGAGLAELKKALVEQAQHVLEKDVRRNFRLPIDRAFSIKGFGTVVTGTLVSGHVAVGDEVELLPSNARLRVRGVQSGGKSSERAEAGQRTAVNLAGVDHHSLRRGMVLAEPGRYHATRRIDVKLQLLPSARKLKNRAQVHFHSGSFTTMAGVALFGGTELAGGQEAYAQLKLKQSVLLLPGDRFIIRQSSPLLTIGGGAVLDPIPRRPRVNDPPRQSFLSAVEENDKPEILGQLVERALFGLPQKEIAARTGWTDSEIRDTVRALAEAKQIRLMAGDAPVLYPAAAFDDLLKKIADRVEHFHKQNPLQPGIAREDLRTALARRLRPEIFRAALEELTAQKKLELKGEVVKRAGAQVSLLPEETKAKDQIEAAFASAGLAVPSVKEVLGNLSIEARRSEKLLQLLLRDKVLIRITPELVFHRDALAQLRIKLTSYKKAKGERMSVPAFKDLTGITRKYAIPLLEYLDRERVTRRQGDERVIL